MNADLITKLQRSRGYQGWRIRPHPFNSAVWLAETYTFLGHGNKKGWRALREAKRGDYRTFATPVQAYKALVALQKEFDDLDEDEPSH